MAGTVPRFRVGIVVCAAGCLVVGVLGGCGRVEPPQQGQRSPKSLPPAVKTALQRGDEALKKNDRKAAISAYTEALKLDPKLKRAYVGRGVAYNELGDARKALEDFTKAIELDPEDSYPYEQREKIYRQLKEYAKADADKEKAFALREKRRERIREDRNKWMQSQSKNKKG